MVLIVGLVASGCTGGSDSTKDPGPSLPLPQKAPTARGPATGPAMAPKVLLASSDELEETTGSLDTAQVQRRSGAFVSGKTVVGYSVDNISGYDLGSGKLLWTADLDMGSGTVCFASQPDRAVTTFTVAYGESGFCPNLATIRVADGTVVAESDKLTTAEKFEGSFAGGTVRHLFTVEGHDHVVDSRGVVWKMVKGAPEPISRLETESYFDLYPSPGGDVLIGTRLSDRGRCRVDGYELPSFEKIWTEDTSTLFPDVREDCIISASAGSPGWLMQETAKKYYMVQVDPATGKVLGRADAAKNSGAKAAEGEFNLASASNQFDRALGLPGGDTVFAQVRGLTRYSLEGGKVVWDLDLSQLQLDSDEDYPLTTVLPQGVTADGYLVATVSNDTSAEIIAVEAKTGKLVARWPLPPEYRNGFQVEPGMTLFGGGVVLTRNFRMWEYTFADYQEHKEPTADRYDIGVFTFPEPDESAAAAVPTAGPPAADAKSIGGLKTPGGSTGDRDAGAFSTGGQLIAYAGNTVTGIDPKSGKKLWSTQVDDDRAASVCVAPEPDEEVKTFTIALRGGKEGDRCDTLLRMNASDGTVMDRVEVPEAARSVSRIQVHQRSVFIITGDQKVGRLVEGALVEQARLAHRPYYLERTPQDPALLISAAPIKDGRDWAIDAYRAPSFERVWSTTATKVLSKVQRSSPISVWRGNGLWVSTTYGDASDEKAKVKDSLVQLDPDDGRVVARTGAVERDYLADDLGRFTLTGAISSGQDTVGFGNGDVVVPQSPGIMRYSLTDKAVRWAVDTTSITRAMERDRTGSPTSQHFDLISGGKTVLVTLSNGTSVELMTLDASSGKITGRWNVPTKARNGLQASPAVTPFAGGFALSHDDAGWAYAFEQTGRKPPSTQRHDVGLFRLSKPSS